MPRALRSELFVPEEVCIVHCVQRCVRRAFLAGVDPVSGKDFEFRREWIRRRLEVLASVFGIDILAYAIMSNHMHLVLRNRPDVVKSWSDREVAERWLKLFPGRRLDEYLGQPSEQDIDALAGNAERLEIIRSRLSDISWFMRSASEPIARMANKQDECTGRFWEGRFKGQRITDEAGLLACAMYVDLNPIRAAMAESPETSEHTSAYDRIRAEQGDKVRPLAADVQPLTLDESAELIKTTSVRQRRKQAALAKKKARAAARRMRRDAWLAPLSLAAKYAQGETDSVAANKRGVRASDKGFLTLKLREYLQLLDWTGRQGQKDKRGKIPDTLSPILSRLGIDGGMWCDLVWNFRKYFRGTSAGKPSSMQANANDRGQRWAHGQSAARACFAGG